MPYVVMVALTVDEPTPEEAIAFVRAELRARLGDLGDGEPPGRAATPDLLPRWRITSVRKVTRLAERGGPAG